MKIAIYQPRASYYMGGGEVVPLEQAKLLAEKGHEIHLLTTKASFIKPIESFKKFKKYSKVRVEYIEIPKQLKWIYDREPGSDWSRWDLESLYVGRMAYEYFISKEYDAVVCHNLFDSIAVPSKLISIMHLHGTPYKFEPHHSYLATLPDAFTAVSDSVAEKWSTLETIKSRPIVIKNGVDITRFKPNNSIPVYDFLYIGRLLPVKGVDVLIKALANIKKMYNISLQLAVAGSGPYRRELEKLLKELEMEDQVSFLGYVDDSKLPSIYSNSKICVFPSKDKEGVLTTMLEAAASKRAIIASKVGGIPEFLVDGVNGLLTIPNNNEDLANKMYKLYSDVNLQNRIRENAYNEIQTNWNWKTKINEVDSFYNQVINKGK